MAAKFAAMQDGFNMFVRKPSEVEVDKTYEIIHPKNVLFESYISAVGRGQRRLPPSTAPFTKIVARKIVSVSSKIVFVIRNLWKGGKSRLSDLYKTANSRSELVATFLAVLELCKSNRVEVSGDGEMQEITLIKGHKRK
jgi:segregation and condensation protein A